MASQEQSNFKFPPLSSDTGSHRKTNSNLVPSFKFPPTNTNYDVSNNDDDFIPTSSTHRRQRTRNNNNNGEPFSPSGINSNWRTQSISQNQQSSSNQFLSPQFQPLPPQSTQQQQSYPYNQSPYRGHRKANSRDFNSFSSLEPPAVFQQGHRSRPSNSSIQSFQYNTTNGGTQRKSLFAP